ncbi:MAG: hypothetical protein HZB64_04305 [Rhodocyclales bacterium]|nr:hypothetical protein [Rhodocyclales bacterium]
MASVKAFQIGKTEVTLGQFKKFIEATGDARLASSTCTMTIRLSCRYLGMMRKHSSNG